ncbi:hypothetical protein L210DRAFT_3652191 [Boletus edulis BED1]|uniref:Uncharacterized protein n=1 Tax=Boletus edulis BED1 TaxID=1328754 RepID=A0AAD4G816_BOLED|nr:hypothetical protein L210DRAFT_3652191 [Boletus edulis BED1]
MTPSDSIPRTSDNDPGSCSMLADETIGVLVALLQGVQLSEERATIIISTVRSIATDASPATDSSCSGSQSENVEEKPGTPPAPASPGVNVGVNTGANADVNAAAGIGTSISASPACVQASLKAAAIPSGHYSVTHSGVDFLLPYEGETGPFYLITKGKKVGIIANWEKASPMVHRVCCATYRRLPSGTTICKGYQMVKQAIDDGLVHVI